LLAAAPFAGKGEINGFWQFNKALLLRLLTSLLYTLVLYAGLAIALAALENLFGLSIPGKRYGELWILINGLFTTWFVLAGVPGNLAELDTMTDYPKGLRVFAQYILFPIVLIYFVILYAYLAKILIDWDWPQGWVSKLILGFSGAGIFLLLLLFPVVGRAGSIWITRAARWFYITLVPLVVMLFLAVWRRVSEYGITEGRYLAIALGVWLLFLILYFTLSKVKSVRLIPASLCTLAFIVSFGPWGTFSVSRESQIGRLKKLAEDAGMFADGKIRPIHGEISFEHAKQISAVLSYLQEIHGFEGIQSWFDQSLKDDAIPSGVAYKSPNVVARMMGMEYVVRWAEAAAGTIVLNADAAFDPSGYDRMVHMLLYSGGAQRVEILPDGIAYRVSEGMEKLTFAEIDGGRDLLEIDLRRHAEGLLQKYRTSATGRIPNEEMAVRAAGNGLSVQVCPWQIQCQQHEGGTKLFRIDAVILYSGKRKAVE
jgi:hypothetical protein